VAIGSSQLAPPLSVGGVAIKFHDSVFTYRFIEPRKRISRTLLSDKTLSVRPR
jgi:hypothetical protein